MSRAGARGLFQFMPATEREYGINAMDPAQAANAAAKKMAGLMSRYHGNPTAALSAYNWAKVILSGTDSLTRPLRRAIMRRQFWRAWRRSIPAKQAQGTRSH
ncbi:lytic transglycosylase domain-containing protein [Paraburkholderia sediminicola]|uniref:lytic transglycosylase domain-containing protein n=1 Tax=Paraburkholderia sediminicola TaxID=458836 RepID=UPI0038BD09C8